MWIFVPEDKAQLALIPKQSSKYKSREEKPHNLLTPSGAVCMQVLNLATLVQLCTLVVILNLVLSADTRPSLSGATCNQGLSNRGRARNLRVAGEGTTRERGGARERPPRAARRGRRGLQGTASTGDDGGSA
jgi:hypothetical protein